MALVERLDVVWYRVQDWDAARTFYTTVLGLSVTAEDADEWLELAPGGVVRLGLAGVPIDDLHGGAVPVFYVRDLAATVATLQAQGATVELLSATADGSQGAFFFDPVGNRLQLLQPPAAAQAAMPPGDWDGTARLPRPSGDGLITGITFIWYLTTYPEWEDARRFYTETLGLPVISLSNTPPHWAIFATGTPVELSLGTTEGDQAAPAGACVVVLEVRDMDAAMARLHAHRIEHTEESDPGGRMVSFYDPDGNQLQFHWTRP